MREHDVLADIRAIRDELAARHGGDARSLSRALIERSRAVPSSGSRRAYPHRQEH